MCTGLQVEHQARQAHLDTHVLVPRLEGCLHAAFALRGFRAPGLELRHPQTLKASQRRGAGRQPLKHACTRRVHARSVGNITVRTVQEALGVGEGEVEVWVVRAIGRKLLAARIDQMRRTVAVTKCAQRTFSAAQWRALLAQLGAWKARPRLPCRPGPQAALDAAALHSEALAHFYSWSRATGSCMCCPQLVTAACRLHSWHPSWSAPSCLCVK